MIKVNYAVASQVPSEDMPAAGITRGKRGANPTNSTESGHRETAPLAGSATPRVKHPAINVEPWSTSYAQDRTEPKTARAKGKRNANKRMKSIRKQIKTKGGGLCRNGL
jgi:hypothetical protein